MSRPATAELAHRVEESIRKHLPELRAEISPTATLEELGMDSMTLVDVVLDLQDEYSVVLPDDVLMNIDVVADLVEILRTLTASPRSSVAGA